MERQIKFRGKNIHTGEWLYGDYHREGKMHYITKFGDFLREYAPIEFIVDENTIGQFTGILDKNGKEIYEGDILSDGEVKYEVWYSEDKTGFIAEMRDPQNDLVDYLGSYDTERIMTIIGSIYDHPDLLNGK